MYKPLERVPEVRVLIPAFPVQNMCSQLLIGELYWAENLSVDLVPGTVILLYQQSTLALDLGYHANIPCYANETLPERNDITIPRIGRKVYGIPPCTRLTYLQHVMQHRVLNSGLGFVCPQDQRLLNLGPNTHFFLVFQVVVVLREFQHELSVVINEPWVACLQEQGPDPCILPVNETRNTVVVNEYVRRMNIPAP
jgi:hypothetical protein